MTERDQALAEFQAFTGIEDVEHSIAVLEQHDWNVMEAVQNTMAGMDPMPDEQMLVEEIGPPSYSLVSSGFEPLGEGLIGRRIMNTLPNTVSSDGDSHDGLAAIAPEEEAAATPSPAFAIGFSAQPSTSRVSSRLLYFRIEYQCSVHTVVVDDSETVGKVKELLAGLISVDKSEIELTGWHMRKENEIVPDDMLLRLLHLPKETSVNLHTPNVVASNCKPSHEAGECSNKTYKLLITNKDTGKNFSLNFPGTKTMQEVKEDVFALTSVAPRHQMWTGWPHNNSSDNTTTLTASGISHPCHSLSFSVSQTEPKNATTTPPSQVVELVSDSDSDEFLDANYDQDEEEDEVMFAEPASTRKTEPLMPEKSTDQTRALEQFVRGFAARYGENHPVFYIGTLEDALKDSLHCSAKERKLLAVYLHHDGSILTNVFCSQLLCADTVISYLCSHFLLWAWDLTEEANKARLISLCARHFGNLAASTVRSFGADEMPMLLIISRNRATNEVVQVIRGNTTLGELVAQLMHSQEVFSQQLAADIAEEDEREARELIKQEQEAAYQESLALDRAKAQSRQAEEEARREQEKRELEERMRAEDERRMEEEEKMAIAQSLAEQLPDEPSPDCSEPVSTIRFRAPGSELIVRRFLAQHPLQILLNFVASPISHAIAQSLAEQLPDEPSPDCSEPVSTIRFRAPGSELIVRRFLAQHPLQILLNFVASKGFHTEDYKVLTTFPRRDLTQLDASQSLGALNLYPQETITLEEK